MKKIIKLDSPVKINGADVGELPYDVSKITADQFLQACTKSADMAKSQTISFKLKENDYALHMYLGFMAVIAENPGIALEDLERIEGMDLLKFTDVGMLFIYRRSEGASEGNSSDEQSETTPEISTQAPPTSGE